MTPEQSAAYINAQIAMFYGELEMIKALGTVVQLHTNRDEIASVDRICDPIKLKVLMERYECVLGHNAVLSTFAHANAAAGRV